MITDTNNKIIKPPHQLIIDENSFQEYQETITLFGDGSDKCKELFKDSKHIQFISGITPTAKTIGEIAWQKYQAKEFENLVTFEPFYLKEFYTPKAKDPLKQTAN